MNPRKDDFLRLKRDEFWKRNYQSVEFGANKHSEKFHEAVQIVNFEIQSCLLFYTQLHIQKKKEHLQTHIVSIHEGEKVFTYLHIKNLMFAKTWCELL